MTKEINMAPNVSVVITQEYVYDSHNHKDENLYSRYRISVHYYMTINDVEHDMGIAIALLDNNFEIEEFDNRTNMDDIIIEDIIHRAVNLYKEGL